MDSRSLWTQVGATRARARSTLAPFIISFVFVVVSGRVFGEGEAAYLHIFVCAFAFSSLDFQSMRIVRQAL